MDYKERFKALLNEMVADKNGGLIPPMIAETIHELELEGNTNIEYWTLQNMWGQATGNLKK